MHWDIKNGLNEKRDILQNPTNPSTAALWFLCQLPSLVLIVTLAFFKKSFLANDAGTVLFPYTHKERHVQRKQTKQKTQNFNPHIKTNSKWIIELSLRNLIKKTGENLCKHGLSKEFLYS